MEIEDFITEVSSEEYDLYSHKNAAEIFVGSTSFEVPKSWFGLIIISSETRFFCSLRDKVPDKLLLKLNLVARNHLLKEHLVGIMDDYFEKIDEKNLLESSPYPRQILPHRERLLTLRNTLILSRAIWPDFIV